MGKLLEEFRKGRSIEDAIQAVVNIATNTRKETGKRKRFCALVSIDIRNAFNTARWNICIEAMMPKNMLLLRFPLDNAGHALFVCAKWGVAMEAVTPDTMVPLILQSERIWTLIESFIIIVMKTRGFDGRRGQNNGEGQYVSHQSPSPDREFRADWSVALNRGRIFSLAWLVRLVG